MIHTDILEQFPLYRRIDNKNLFNANNEIIYDHSFDDTKVVFFRIYEKIPSYFANELNMRDFSKILDFLKVKGFELLSSSITVSSEETHNVYLIHDSKEMLIKLNYSFYNMNKKNSNKISAYSEIYGDEDYNITGQGDDGDNQVYITIAYTPSQGNYDFITEYKSMMTIDDVAENLVFMFEKDSNGRFKLTPHKIEGFDIDIDKHYNDDFKEIDDKIKTWCSDFKTINKRLVMLEGVAGTGKTNYIKHLLTVNTDIRKIYIPPYYIEAISDPGFFGFIKKYKNSILLLEDAEKVLVSRTIDSSNSGISVLLNLTDGILASVLNFKIICTFNTNDKEIDGALKRKGRLFTRYHFDKLDENKTQELYYSLYNKNPVEKTMSLGDIYNAEDNGEVKKEERTMGFSN